MTAPAPAHTRPYARRTTARQQARPEVSPEAPPPDAAQTRLPWWAVALPALAFAALLVLLDGGEASAAGQVAPQLLADVLERVEQALLG